jgi:hypothetical protein
MRQRFITADDNTNCCNFSLNTIALSSFEDVGLCGARLGVGEVLCLIALASSMRNGSSLNAVLVVDVPTKHNKSKTNSWYF